MATLRLSLVENGIDFIREGVEMFFMEDNPRPEAHKYAVIHLFSGALLILKERLRREHPSLVWRDVTKANDVNFPTVSFDELLERLEKIARVQIGREHLQLLRSMQRTRNRLEHFDCELSLEQTQELIGTATEFLDVFLKTELDTELRDVMPAPVWHRLSELSGIANRIERERLAAWRERASAYEDLTDSQLDEMRRVEPFHPKHNPDPEELLECPQCGERSVATTDDPTIGVCTDANCRQVLHRRSCDICGAATIEAVWCENCQAHYDHQMAKD